MNTTEKLNKILDTQEGKLVLSSSLKPSLTDNKSQTEKKIDWIMTTTNRS